MSNIAALNAVTAGATNPAAALEVLPSADAAAVLNDIVSQPNLTDGERTALAQAAAYVDQNIAVQPARAEALAQVSGLGLYLSSTSTDSIPRWTVLTGLRAYGLNLKEPAPQPTPTPQQAQAQVAQKLQAVARASRNVSLDTALAVAKAPTPVVEVAAAPAPKPAASKSASAAPAHLVSKIV
jgi:hypothetical protein